MMAAESRRPHDGPRPYSAGDGAGRRPLIGEPPQPPFARSSSLETGIIGAPPPLVRDSDHRFTAAEVEGLLAVREKELLSVKRRLHRASKKNDSLASTVQLLKDEGSGLRRTVKEGTEIQDVLQLRVSELEDVVKRKAVALKTSNHRRERVEETAKADAAQARGAAELARRALEEAGRKGSSLRDRALDAETRVKSLHLRLEVSGAQAAEAKRVAAEELAGRVSAHERDRVALEATVSAAEEDNRCLRQKLAEALNGVRQKQEAERQTDKVVRELQAWRERVASGHVVEMSSSEAKHLRWSEEQTELMKQANSNLRSQLLESGRLLAEAEHSFETVTTGFGDARVTIDGLSAKLDQKNKGLLEAERELRGLRAEASRLKKRVTSLQLGLSEEQRRLRGRERALDSTRRGMEALVRGKQQEVEAKSREAEKRRAAERASAHTAAENESLQLRAEVAEACLREMDAERRVLLQHVFAAREEAALLRSGKTVMSSPSKPGTAPGPASSATTSNVTLKVNTQHSSCCTERWRETIRSLLERAVSDWSVKSLFRPVSTPTTERKGRSKHRRSSQRSTDESSSDSMPETFPEEEASTTTATEVGTSATKSGDRLAAAAVGHDSAGNSRKRRDRSRESVHPGNATEVPRPLEVVRVYGAPEKEGSNRAAGWRWDLELPPTCAREIDSHGTGEILAALGLRTLGRSLRERGVRGEGARVALTAVARVLDALVLTRSLAAQQCAQVRAELALALGRLSTRSLLVSNTRSVARRASTCNRTLLLRLVDSELRHWRERATTAAASGNQENVETIPDGEDKDDYAYETANDTSDSQTSGNEAEGGDLGGEREAIDADSRIQGRQRSPLQNMGLGGERAKPPPAGTGVVLNLSNVGVDDETLGRVAKAVLRMCIHGSHRQKNHVKHKGTSKTKAVVPLARLLLRGNNISDAGALTLVPFVKESPHVTELDLRDNAIGANGKLALKKALACNPWVHRVVSEDVCDTLGERGGVGGLVLRGKRHPRSTATDRARAYAFERIPLPLNASLSRLGSRCSTNGKPKDQEHTSSANHGRAPAYGGSTACVSPTKNETQRRSGEKKRLSLMQPSALESFTRTPFTEVAPSCRIDLRGCSRRPMTLPLVNIQGSDSRDSLPTSAAEMSTPYDRRRVGRRHQRRNPTPFRGPSTSTKSGPLDTRRTRDPVVDLKKVKAGVESIDLRGAVGAPSRRLRHTRSLNRVDRGGDCPHPLDPEKREEDGLAQLLTVSRRIFSKTEGYEETRHRPGEPPRTTKPEVRTRKPGEIDPPGTSRASVSPAVEAANTPNASSANGDDSPLSRPHRGVRWMRAPRYLNNSSEIAPTAARMVKESRGLGSIHDVQSHEKNTREGTHPESILGPSEVHSALEEEPPVETTPAPVEGEETLEISDGKEQASRMNEGLVRNFASPGTSEDGDAVLQTGGGSNTSAVVADAATWDDAQQTSGHAGWAYDEATSSWFAVTATSATAPGTGDGQAHTGRGWRFDEQSATWYQDEWQGQGPHEPSYTEAFEHSAVTSEVLEEPRAPDENHVQNIGESGDERMGGTCEMLLKEGIERENAETGEAGGLVTKRIKALELALHNRSDS